MQATLNQLAEILAERAGRQFDFAFKQEMKVVVNYWRARLIVDSLNSRPNDRMFFTKWIEIPLEQANISDFPGFPTDCKILKTKCIIPRPVRANSKMYDFVGKLDRATVIPFLEPYQIKALRESEYTGKIPRATEMNGYGYVFDTKNLTGIAVQLIPEDVEEYLFCCEECSSECPSDDIAYAVSSDLQQRIIQAALATELRIPTEPKTQEVTIDGKR